MKRLLVIFVTLIAACSGSPDEVFVPLGHVNGIEPGIATYEDVVQSLGPPAVVEEVAPPESTGVFLGSDTIIRYPERGIHILLAGPPADTAGARVEAITVGAPYPGRSPEGLYLGMPSDEAMALLDELYAVALDLDDSRVYARNENREDTFQVWFDQDVLSKIQVVAPQSASMPLETTTNRFGMTFVLLRDGQFMMGERGADNTEPVHEVHLSRPFYISAYETTQRQWKRIMDTEPWNGKETPDTGDAYPATHVSWTDVQAFLERLNAASDSGRYRLPTEAEWEYAARAGTATTYSFGNDPEELHRYGNYLDKEAFQALKESPYYRRYGVASLLLRGPDTTRSDGYAYTAPVGSYRPNPWGLYDMHGNVWEWVADYWGDYPSRAVTDPTGAAHGDRRIMRGGAWQEPAPTVRSAARSMNIPEARLGVLGFRLVFEHTKEIGDAEGVAEISHRPRKPIAAKPAE